MNKVPKPWFEKEIYVQLIANEDEANPFYDCIPRLWAFEVSTVVEGKYDILLYSKMMSRMWPDASMLARKVKAFADDKRNGMSGAALKTKYYTTGIQKAVSRKRNAGLSNTQTSFNPRSTGLSYASFASRRVSRQPMQEEEPIRV